MSCRGEPESATAPSDWSETAGAGSVAGEPVAGFAPSQAVPPVVARAERSCRERPGEASPDSSAVLSDQARDAATSQCDLCPKRYSCSVGAGLSASQGAIPDR